MKRELVAAAQTRQVRVVANILTKGDFFLCRLVAWTLEGKITEGSRKVRFSTLKVMAL